MNPAYHKYMKFAVVDGEYADHIGTIHSFNFDTSTVELIFGADPVPVPFDRSQLLLVHHDPCPRCELHDQKSMPTSYIVGTPHPYEPVVGKMIFGGTFTIGVPMPNGKLSPSDLADTACDTLKLIAKSAPFNVAEHAEFTERLFNRLLPEDDV